MTMTLAHPDAEDLGRFIEGTLDDAGRASIVDHIADCDECRVVVVDSSAFIEPAHTADRRWWLPVAAAIAIVLGGIFTWSTLRDPLTPVIEAAAHLPSRPVEARLSGFNYLERRTNRGGEQDETDLASLQLEGEVGKVLERRGDDPRTLHAKGIALLVSAGSKTNERDQIVDQREKAVAFLEAAARRAPDNASYQSDFAGALIATGDPANFKRAVEVTDRALQIDRRSAEALFNRAKAFESLGQADQAIAAYKAYLAVDSSSRWAEEARTHLGMIQPSLPPT